MRLTRRRGTSHATEEENPYWVSFSDIMSGLLIIFILAAVALMLQLLITQEDAIAAEAELQQQLTAQQAQQDAFDGEIAKISDAEEVRRQVIDELVTELEKNGIKVVVNEDASVLSIPSEALGFASGSYEVEASYQARARLIGQVLNDIVRKDGRTAYLDTIFVEGHTDGEPFDGPLGMGNWGLSTFRAISLWQLWEEALSPGARLGELTNAEGKTLFSVSGYADTRPVDGVDRGANEHAPNRRIDVRITIVRPSSDELERISEEFRVGQTP